MTSRVTVTAGEGRDVQVHMIDTSSKGIDGDLMTTLGPVETVRSGETGEFHAWKGRCLFIREVPAGRTSDE